MARIRASTQALPESTSSLRWDALRTQVPISIRCMATLACLVAQFLVIVKSLETWMASNGSGSEVSFRSELASSPVTVMFVWSLSCCVQLASSIALCLLHETYQLHPLSVVTRSRLLRSQTTSVRPLDRTESSSIAH